MTSRERFLAALRRQKPDRLPVTTHHIMPSFLKSYMKGFSEQDFFDTFGLDPLLWLVAHRPDASRGEYLDPGQGELEFLQPPRICSGNWRIETENIIHTRYKSVRYSFITPRNTLSMVLQNDNKTTWIAERLIKEKSDMEVFIRFAPVPLCDVVEVNRQAQAFGERGMVRGSIPGFDVYGQPGCWPEAAVLYGIEKLIMQTYDDPVWVNEFLSGLMERKKRYIRSLDDADFDLIELGGGDASSTVISPRIFDEFVAPFDTELIILLHEMEQKVVYHTCGGMMPFLEKIAGMGPDAMETFTPESLGGDVDLSTAKSRIGDLVCMIGGFDQAHFLFGCSSEDTRRAVRQCFHDAGKGGGFILSPSDHFFDADPILLQAFADEARKCTYAPS